MPAADIYIFIAGPEFVYPIALEHFMLGILLPFNEV